MSPNRKPSKQKFLSDYTTAENYLLKPDKATGRPGLLTGQDQHGRDVLIKYWPRVSAGNDSDLLHIWRSEIRQLQRLAAIPRADDLFVPMLASGEDDEGFYLVLDPGQGTPLECFRMAGNPRTMLAQPRLPQNRRLIWSNALRLARALDLLHAQGVIHRNIDPWAIITSLDDQADFRLTGFEWSMRIASLDTGSAGKPGASTPAASFGHDWRNLGLLIADLLGAPAERVADLRLPPTEIARHLSSAEGRALRTMIGVENVDRLDGQLTCRRIEEIVAEIGAQVAGRNTKLAIALRLGPDTKLGAAIRRASGDDIEMADVAAQVQFAKDDLSDEPFLARVRDPEKTDPQIVLLGQKLAYALTPYRQPGTATPADWEFATCERASATRPSSVLGSVLLQPESLDLVPSTDANKAFPLRRGKVARWDEAIRGLEPKESRKTELDRKHQSFALLSILEMAYAAADIFPVQIRPSPADDTGDIHHLSVVPRNDDTRAALSKALKLQPPAVRLAKMLENDDVVGDTGWILVTSGSLGERKDHDSEWKFVEGGGQDAPEVLHFEGNEKTTLDGAAYLAPAGMRGQIPQFRRRVKALKTLREHTELLKMLVDPRLRIEKSHDPVVEDERFKSLDPSKKSALTEILSTVPLFLLQGPPGVGKTYMVGDIVRRRFDDEPTTRLLLSAQSNAAIDHLMKEVQTVFSEANKPVMIRARPADDDGADTDLEIDKQANIHLQALCGSDLLAEADEAIADKVKALAAASATRAKTGKRHMTAEARAFEAMILRAANLVFATTNSAAVENLLEERGFFDWTIIEEAGKATGGELLSPLLLSHRRLMIGDHKQLPPYGSDRLEKLLADPAAVKTAVKAAEELISRQLRDPAIEEIFEEVEDESLDYGHLCADTLAALNLFASLVEAELAPRPDKAPRTAIARRLDEQHRMHPAIAKIVSSCFYQCTLETNKDKARYYRNTPAPFKSSDPAVLPDTPIVFVDMPYCREQVGYKGRDQGPAWSNPDESNAVVKALHYLVPERGRAPSLAILSPYREQVKRLTRDVDRAAASSLQSLGGFLPAVGDESYCGTVDSFQGDQADLVIVSMVRNNGHAAPSKSLGFLRDDRRMNVLLSRAKWRLIIVGSLRFYESVSELAETLPESDIGFLKRFLKALAAAKGAGDAAIVPWATLTGARP